MAEQKVSEESNVKRAEIEAMMDCGFLEKKFRGDTQEQSLDSVV